MEGKKSWIINNVLNVLVCSIAYCPKGSSKCGTTRKITCTQRCYTIKSNKASSKICGFSLAVPYFDESAGRFKIQKKRVKVLRDTTYQNVS